MNKPKINRLNRILRLEEKNLDQIVLNLKQVNQKLTELEKLQQLVASRHASAINASASSISIQHLETLSLYSDSADSKIVHIKEQAKETLEQRSQLLDEVATSRSKIKGWEKLIEKLKREDLESIEKSAMLEADDRVLREIAINGSKL